MTYALEMNKETVTTCLSDDNAARTRKQFSHAEKKSTSKVVDLIPDRM
jgi:hypothetical protein